MLNTSSVFILISHVVIHPNCTAIAEIMQKAKQLDTAPPSHAPASPPISTRPVTRVSDLSTFPSMTVTNRQFYDQASTATKPMGSVQPTVINRITTPSRITISSSKPGMEMSTHHQSRGPTTVTRHISRTLETKAPSWITGVTGNGESNSFYCI